MSYRLFISHSWTYSDAYEKLIDLLANQDLDYYNHSIPMSDPVHTNGSDKQLTEAIDAKIRGVSCVLILAGVYSSYSRWIDEEIRIAKQYNKPIAIEPWGAERTSQKVKSNANRIVKWQGSSVVNAIKDLCK